MDVQHRRAGVVAIDGRLDLLVPGQGNVGIARQPGRTIGRSRDDQRVHELRQNGIIGVVHRGPQGSGPSKADLNEAALGSLPQAGAVRPTFCAIGHFFFKWNGLDHVYDSRSTEGLHRVGVASEIPGLLRDLGHAPEPVFARADWPRTRSTIWMAIFPFRALGSFAGRRVAQTGCVQFGVMLGAGWNEEPPPGRRNHAIRRRSATASSISLHQPRYTKGAVTYLTTDADTASGATAFMSPTPAIEQICDAAMSLVFRSCESSSGAGRNRFSLPRETGTRRIECLPRAFGIEPTFDADRHAVLFPQGVAATSRDRRGSEAAHRGRKIADTFWSQVEHTFSERVARHSGEVVLKATCRLRQWRNTFADPEDIQPSPRKRWHNAFRDLLKDAIHRGQSNFRGHEKCRLRTSVCIGIRGDRNLFPCVRVACGRHAVGVAGVASQQVKSLSYGFTHSPRAPSWRWAGRRASS